MKCAWCKTADAIGDYWVREIGEFRDSKTPLCKDCHAKLLEEGGQAAPANEVIYQGKTYQVEPCRRCRKLYEERREVADATSKFSGMAEMVWICQCFTFNTMELRS